MTYAILGASSGLLMDFYGCRRAPVHVARQGASIVKEKSAAPISENRQNGAGGFNLRPLERIL
jgi:hypothetical protein